MCLLTDCLQHKHAYATHHELGRGWGLLWGYYSQGLMMPQKQQLGCHLHCCLLQHRFPEKHRSTLDQCVSYLMSDTLPLLSRLRSLHIACQARAAGIHCVCISQQIHMRTTHCLRICSITAVQEDQPKLSLKMAEHMRKPQSCLLL